LAHITPKAPLLRVFLYSDSIFDIPKIERRVEEINAQADSYRETSFPGHAAFRRIVLPQHRDEFRTRALWFLGDLDHSAANARSSYTMRKSPN
jgi:hypothetical protein